jgi:hypothetical protein
VRGLTVASNPEMNGRSTIVVIDLGEQVVIHIETLSKRSQLNTRTYSWILHWQMERWLNLRIKEASRHDNQVNSKGRVKVKLFEQDLELLIKLENLEIIEDRA